ncbi:transcription factor [Ganoderma sinense ZZ0214-1]|uniref:Transcription factor n=1 Tax=Ganoderma sinense ZZ0214-1 TaxID=1077348 RepID=A0A2G8S1W4_9APHY|nr:transcription factor [Ganoderma sinense ZZ0214-1]
MTRDMVDRFFPELLDQRGVVTNRNRPIEGPSSSSGSSEPTTTWWATERTWNGSAYECYLCHKTFRSLTALNAHLGSPAHGDKLYHCPREFGGCGKEYRNLSAILQHIEDPGRRCGVRRFDREVDRIFDGLTNSRKWLTGA